MPPSNSSRSSNTSDLRETADRWQAIAYQKLANSDLPDYQKRQVADEMWLAGALHAAFARKPSWIERKWQRFAHRGKEKCRF